MAGKEKMTDEEKMIWLFKEVHGEVTGSCYLEVYEVEDGCVAVMKGGNVCWSKTKIELIFDYLTRHL